MRRMLKTVTFLMSLCALSALAQTEIPASEAGKHIGQRATVCGRVVSGHYASSSKGRPTFINLDKPYPNQVFTIVIWGENRSKFTNPETAYQDKQVCVTGTITEYRKSPQIEARSPNDIKLR